MESMTGGGKRGALRDPSRDKVTYSITSVQRYVCDKTRVRVPLARHAPLPSRKNRVYRPFRFCISFEPRRLSWWAANAIPYHEMRLDIKECTAALFEHL